MRPPSLPCYPVFMERAGIKSSLVFLIALWTGIFPAPPAMAKNLFGAGLCASDPLAYRCFTVLRGDTWEALFPDETQRDLVRRLNRTNLKMRTGDVLAMPENLEKATRSGLSPFPLANPEYSEKTLVFSPIALAWGAYDVQGNLMSWGPASGGKTWCPDVGRSCKTPAGVYAVLYKGGVRCKSRTYPVGKGGAPMPYCVFFRSGYAFHGSAEVPGSNASHGCVRVFPEDARWINESFVELPDAASNTPGTAVIILPYGP